MANYKFLNVNPLGLHERDCVCRAISRAVNEDYYVIERKLKLIAELFECEMLCECCYKYLLDEIYNLIRIEEFKGMTINEFINLHPRGKYIVRVPQHLTYIENGYVLDIWDCTNEIVDVVWVVE